MSSSAFEITIEDVFTIKGRGVVVVGIIAYGEINVGDMVVVTIADAERVKARLATGKQAVLETDIGGIEKLMGRNADGRPQIQAVESASAGDNVGILLSDVAQGELQAGDVVTASLRRD